MLNCALHTTNLLHFSPLHPLNYRSGTTMLETMLDAHPEIWGMGVNSVLSGHLEQFVPALHNAISIDANDNVTRRETSKIVTDTTAL